MASATGADLAEATGWVPPPGWPARTRDECIAVLTTPGARFEMETVTIGGVATRVWKNAPPNLRAIAQLGRSHGDADFVD